jgi:RNA polymerase primary sigma factor
MFALDNLMDAITGSEDGTVSEVEWAARRDAVKQALDCLPPRERRILELHLGLKDGQEYTYEDIGHKFGYSRDWIKTLKTQALSRLRHPSIRGKLWDFWEE